MIAHPTRAQVRRLLGSDARWKLRRVPRCASWDLWANRSPGGAVVLLEWTGGSTSDEIQIPRRLRRAALLLWARTVEIA